MPISRKFAWFATLLWAAWASASLLRAESVPSDKAQQLFQTGEQFEKQGDWDKACECYDLLFRLQRDYPQARERYLHCLRRCWQARRHRDVNFRKEVATLPYSQALRLYTVIRDSLLDHGVDRKKIQPSQLFRRGLEELEHALNDPYFREHFVPADHHGDIPAFREYLARTALEVFPSSRQELNKAIRDVSLSAQSMMRMSSSAAILEIACGSCHALDEHTVYLTPFQLRELCQNLKGESAGVGLSLTSNQGQILISAVTPSGPAASALPPLERYDQILSVDRKSTENVALDEVLLWLEGPVDSMVDLEVLSPVSGMRTVSLRRRALVLPSVAYFRKNDRVAYLQILSFQENTLAEVDAALLDFSKSDAKALVLDLRGNSGGLFDVAVETARRFLSSGVIASTQHSDPKLNKVFQANNPAALTAPMVVLIDADTASAAEVLAGALKENNRAKLVGQTSFGKGCTQVVLKLPMAQGNLPTGGLRVTVARFFSPKGQPYTHRGVQPDLFVERGAMAMSESMLAFDAQLEAAFLEVERPLR